METAEMVEDISEQTWTAFRKRVEAARGRISILAHPYFMEPAEGNESYTKRLRAFLEKSKFPIIILESRSEIPALLARLGPKVTKKVLIIQTLPEAPNPLVDLKKLDPLKIPAHKDVKIYLGNGYMPLSNFAKIISEKTGAKSVFIGGVFAERAFRENPDARLVADLEKKKFSKHTDSALEAKPGVRFINPPTTRGCAGKTYRVFLLSGLFEKISWIPNLRLDMRGLTGKKSPYAKPFVTKKHRQRRA